MTRPDYIDPGDWNLIRYFHEEKGDVSRMIGWDETLAALRQHGHPFATLYDNLIAAQTAFDLAVKSLEYNEED